VEEGVEEAEEAGSRFWIADCRLMRKRGPTATADRQL